MAEEDAFDDYGMGDLGVKLTFRALDLGAWKADVYGEYGIDGGSIFWHSKAADDTFWFDKDMTNYTWMTGIRGGYTTSLFTVAGRVEFAYENTESFNWNDDDDMWANHIVNLGFSGFWRMSDYWSGIVSADYYKVMDHYSEPDAAGSWDLSAGLNLNIDPTKYVGVYVTKEINHVAAGKWEAEDGFGFGAKFGIDF